MAGQSVVQVCLTLGASRACELRLGPHLVELLLLLVLPRHVWGAGFDASFVKMWPDSTVPIIIVCNRETISLGHSCVIAGAMNCKCVAPLLVLFAAAATACARRLHRPPDDPNM